MNYLKIKEIAHLNLNPDSIVIENNTSNIKLTDFRFAIKLKNKDLLNYKDFLKNLI